MDALIKSLKEQSLDPFLYLALLDESAELGFWSFQVANSQVTWSSSVYRLHDQTREDFTLSYASMLDLYPPEDASRFANTLESSLIHKNDFVIDVRIRGAHAKPLHLRLKAKCQQNDHGEVIALVGLVQMASQRLTFPFDATQSYDFQTYLDTSSDGFWDWYIQEDYEYMSPRFWEILGFDAHEKPHKPSAWQDLIFPDDLNIALNNFHQHIETRGEHPFDQEVRYRHKYGSTVHIICRGRVVEWDSAGNPIRMVGTHTDVTQLRENQEKLEEALRFQKLLLAANSDLIFVKDENFKIVMGNDAFVNFFPESMRDKIIGHTTLESFPDNQVDGFLFQDKIAFETGYSETVESARDRIMLTRKKRFTTDDNKNYLLGVSSDITEIKQTETELKQANEELEEFAYRTSHDLRSPLVSSIKLLEITKKTIDKGEIEKAEKYLSLVRESLVKLEALVTDILRLTRLRHTTSEITLTDLPQLVSSMLKQMSHLDGYNKMEILLDLAINSPVYLDKSNLNLVLENLISNAIKYSDPNAHSPYLAIDAKIESNNLAIRVRDNGIGFPESAKSKLFGMFKRFHPQISFGAGLGLYMVKKSIAKMNGKITLVSSYDETIFELMVPLHKENRKE
ncbi:PAS/PAC sensor signal transduction histidine kinase [Teredinibacter turnerae T7901]|uniref:histidine kinase n=1 Tax=Teredinibacter turnerae (strain ATCC 39867 / T7901) TaxID=377629 RepID=C6AR52_TERTT|nr:PAS domain-containing protein [Teredinibacter turnerae]ACS93596.1 PAS/PAC sensor signal transduction histidine kinase [Teredinibacter turnerae T7901]